MIAKAQNYSLINLGPFSETDQYTFTHPNFKLKARGKKFTKNELGLTSMEISVNKLPAGITIPFLHRHKKNEEVYIVIQGEGEFFVDGEWFPIKEGSIVRVATGGVRTLRNLSNEPLHYIAIQGSENSLSMSTIEDGQIV